MNDLLDLAKLESEQVKVDLQETDLAAVIAEVAEEFGTILTQRRLTLKQVDDAGPETAMIDRLRIKQVLRNLLGNAAKFSCEGGELCMTVAPVSGRLRVSVRDQGPGIPEPELETVFGRFEQSSITSPNSGGTGARLAICREILAAHQGRIWAENNSTEGRRSSSRCLRERRHAKPHERELRWGIRFGATRGGGHSGDGFLPRSDERTVNELERRAMTTNTSAGEHAVSPTPDTPRSSDAFRPMVLAGTGVAGRSWP